MINQIYILDMNLKVNKILSINGMNSFFEDTYIIELTTGTETFEFSTIATDIEEGQYVAFYYKNQYKLFTILEIEQEHTEGHNIVSTCYCECSTLQLLNQLVRPFTGDFNCVAFMEYVLQDTEWEVGYYSPTLIDKMQTVIVDRATSIWVVIREYMAKYNLELNARVEMDGNSFAAFYIDLYDSENDSLGRPTNKRFEYSRNVKGITKYKDLKDWCTAVIIEGVDVSSVSFNVEGFTKNGDTIIDEEANTKYNKGRKPVFGVYESNSDDAVTACENALADLKKRSIPHWDYEVTTAMTFKEYEEINIGDEVHIVDTTYSPELLLSARVTELQLSFTNPDNCKMTLSNYKELISGIRTNATIYQELINYINNLQAGILSQSQIQTLIDYMESITIQNAEVNSIIAELKKIAYDKFNELERSKVYGTNVDILLTEGRDYICQDTVSYIKFTAPSLSSCSVNYEVTLAFTTRDDMPTGIHQDNNIWLVGDATCDGMDVMNGGLLPKCDCTYTIVITRNGDTDFPRDFKGVVTKVNNGQYEYIGFEPATNYGEEVVKVMKTYYDNREGNFKYSTTTPYTYSNPQAKIDKWKTGDLYHCDCSTYVGMACRGITYDKSIYTDNTRNPYNCSTDYNWSFALPRYAATQAQYCLEQGWALDLDVTNINDWAKLQKGDLVFWKKRTGDDETNATVNDRFMQVGHVAIISGLKDVDGQIIPHTYESTGSSSMTLCFYNRLLTNNRPELLLFFARPRK